MNDKSHRSTNLRRQVDERAQLLARALVFVGSESWQILRACALWVAAVPLALWLGTRWLCTGLRPDEEDPR